MNLHILIAAYGKEALKGIASLPHPGYPGVDYTVNWQKHEGAPIPPQLQEREDFRIIRDDTTGLCNARNSLLKAALERMDANPDAQHRALISDDDVSYSTEDLRRLIEALKKNPEYGFLTFRYDSSRHHKFYPEEEFEFPYTPKGYFVSSIEIALNLTLLRPLIEKRGHRLFNTAFGINGSLFCAGEEDVAIELLLRNGFRGKYIPEYIASHPMESTSDRIFNTRSFVETKAAGMLYTKRFTWPARMGVHALRAARLKDDNHVGFFRFCGWWLSGVKKAVSHRVFR